MHTHTNAYVHTHPTPHTHSTHNHTHTTHTKSLQPQAHPLSSTKPHLTTDHPLIITTTTMQFKRFSCLPSITREVQTQLLELQATLNHNRRKVSTISRHFSPKVTSKDGHTHHSKVLLQAVGWFSLLDKLYMPSLSQHRWSFQWGTADTSLRFHSKSCPQYTPLQDRTYCDYTAAVSHRIKHIIVNNITKN